MSEEWEVDTERVREALHEGMERDGGQLLKQIALTTALLAACAAIAALQAGATANEALALKTEATQLQAQASDQWAYYQAKGLKAALQEVARQVWLAGGKEAPSTFAAEEARYRTEQAAIEKEARALERTRDTKAHEAEELMHRHHGFAYGVTLFQVAIPLGAIAALTRTRLVWLGSLVVGVGGLVLLVS